MPEQQAYMYKNEYDRVSRGEIKILQGLHAWKRISLAPRPFDTWLEGSEAFIKGSGRLIEFFKILDIVSETGDKALIFLENRELQPILAQVLKERYALRKIPLIINGAISGKARQEAVAEFQSDDDGFNVILISPKAGGVGLNLVAATHVIHLERWWNPAVEDQCNDRAYRLGQTKDVNIYTPVSKHPLDEIRSFDIVLDEILEKKRTLSQSCLFRQKYPKMNLQLSSMQIHQLL